MAKLESSGTSYIDQLMGQHKNHTAPEDESAMKSNNFDIEELQTRKFI
jgi:hypothetical protein